MHIYANITLTKKNTLKKFYLYVIFIYHECIHYIFYVLLTMADPDCYDLVSRNEIKPSTTTDSTPTVGESDTGQDHKYNLHKEISILKMFS